MKLYCPQCDKIRGQHETKRGLQCMSCKHVQPVNSIKSIGTTTMFGENNELTASTNNGSEILKSGYNPTQIKGTQKLRTEFSQALDLDPEQAKKGVIKEYATKHGKYKAMAATVKRLSDEKLGAAKGMHQVYDAVLEHVEKATDLELEWQGSTQEFLEAMSPKLLDLEVGQEQHAGFNEYLDVADRLLKF